MKKDDDARENIIGFAILVAGGTKLNNRYGMDDEIYEQIMEYKKDKTDSFYLLVFDLDNFKHINDTWGHLKGDEALTKVSKALSTASEEYEAKSEKKIEGNSYENCFYCQSRGGAAHRISKIA